VLRLRVVPEDAELTALRNADQAYRIRPIANGLELVGVTGVGVLYAARTLAQLVKIVAPGVVEMPVATILDWPDLAERGEWGGDAAWDMANTAPLKMNLVEFGVMPKVDDKGQFGITVMTPPICEEAQALGVKALPYVPHLGDLGKYSNIFEWRPELVSTPNPDEPLPADYKPSICFSKPAAAQLLSELMTQVIDKMAPCGQELNVWLTEEGKPCFCEQCRGQNAYVLETRLLAAAYRLVKQQHPDFRLRILLTQGSYPDNDKILAATPPDMGVTYYSGTHTYDSSHQPMIYPLLEDYAARGGWLGAYPQLDNSWRTVFPFTGPQFMRARMREFVGKKMESVTGYATPANTFWAFNVAGLAEWSWNAEGRDERQFARAWARRQGIANVDTFAQWACLIGPLGWDLAGSRFPMRLFWDPAKTILAKPTAMTFGGELLSEILSSQQLQRNIALAQQALTLAETLGRPECIAESQVVLNSYLFLKALVGVSSIARDDAALRPQLSAYLAALDAAGEAAVQGLWTWGCLVYPATPEQPQHRFEETMSVFSQVVTEAYRLAVAAGLPDPRPAYRDRVIGTWTEKDFAGAESMFRFDVTDKLGGTGPYRVMFRYLGGSYGVDIHSVAFLEDNGHGAQEVNRFNPRWYGYATNPPPPHIGRYEAWNDVRIELAAVKPGARYFVEVKLGGLPLPGEVAVERRTSNGEICLRRAWA
jgi:hypothetical protein